MPQMCPKCHRANPAEAQFCYLDGSALGGRNGHAGPLDPGAQPFPMPFVFPNGTICRNFDQLALACHNAWSTAIELLRHGDLAHFLAGVGRVDLAKAAREAARDSDKDRALDQLLGQLPANTIEPAKLHVESLQVNLGQLTIGKDQRWELRLANQGMRMLSGTIAVEEGAWLALGEGGGSPRKVFQFQSNTTIPVQVRGKLLRAAAKPIQGRLVLETNGGSATVIVTAEVPVQPFAEGALAGAVTPRQIAEKAKKSPREAAPLFESGAVARWYIQNGWTYPVQGPAASGIGVVQQFFEALGLTTPPKVEVRQSSLVLDGRPGGSVYQMLDLFTPEKRPIFASAVSDALWLKVSRVVLNGNTAQVHLAVEGAPDRPGETLQANVTIRANGNQRFVVPVALRVAGRPRSSTTRRSDGIFPTLQVVEVPTPAEAQPMVVASAAAAPPIRRAPETMRPGALPRAVADTLRASSQPRAADTMHAPPSAGGVLFEAIPLDDEYDHDAPDGRPRRGAVGALLPLLPVAVILIGLLVTGVCDAWRLVHAEPNSKTDVTEVTDASGPSGPPLIDVHFHDQNIDVWYGSVGMKPQGGAADDGERAVWEPSMRFGLSLQRQADPQGRNGVNLTFSDEGPPRGLTNNTCVRLDGEELLFGETGTVIQTGLEKGQRVLGFRGKWIERSAPVDLGTDAAGVKHTGVRSAWFYEREQVLVTQTVAVVGGAQSNHYDTCLVRYRIENQDKRPHAVGLRFLLD
ncbi:MAG TPA: zinc ribbon domain-containing protein, partial [Gemmataceae bacterium]|nr:zinc ribbon domain-containing protein [Gemmataceae bacterium]